MSYKLAGVIWNDDGTMAIEKPNQMNCVYCPIQDLCLEFYNKVLILHDYIEERNCPYKELVNKGELL